MLKLRPLDSELSLLTSRPLVYNNINCRPLQLKRFTSIWPLRHGLQSGYCFYGHPKNKRIGISKYFILVNFFLVKWERFSKGFDIIQKLQI